MAKGRSDRDKGLDREDVGGALSLVFRKPSRECPEDFDVVFVTIGRFECEEHYRARRDTITRWLVERGKQRLIDARAKRVAELRAKGEWITRQTPMVNHRSVRRPSVRESLRDKRSVSVIVARHAAQHLRIRRNGGMIVSPAGEGEWWVGSKRLSAAQMVDLARSKGFQDQVVILTSAEPGEECSPPLHPSAGSEVKS